MIAPSQLFTYGRRTAKPFPGPFICKQGTEGVDQMFDVVCQNTHSVIVSSRYRESKEKAKAIARDVADALNGYRIAHYGPRLSQPGPFAFEASRTFDWAIDIFCCKSKDYIVSVENFKSPCSSLRVAMWIVNALNTTPGKKSL